MQRITTIAGRAIPMRGNDIDTDRIVPARFLRAITFDGMETHLFEDDRKMGGPGHNRHTFDVPAYQGASIMLVNSNFGCGSSREHAPQALMRWGINAIVGGSYAEIFFGNCTANGIPCLAADQADLDWLLRAVEKNPREAIDVDVERQEVRFMGRTIPARIPDGARNQLVSGAWNAMGVLLDAGDAIERTARALPYVSGF